LERRFGALQLTRVALVGFMLATAYFVPRSLGLGFKEVAEMSAGYLAVSFAGWGLDSLCDRMAAVRGSRRRLLFQLVLIPTDSVYLVLLTVPSGGAQSDLIWIFTVQLIAVTLLAGRRTGVRVALWDSALLLAVTFLRLGGTVAQWLGVSQTYAPSAGEVAVRISGFWAVALCTAWFSALSERELRRQKDQLDALTAMAHSMEEVMETADEGLDAGAVAPVLLRSVLGTFGFKRAAVIWQGKGKLFAARAAGGTGQDLEPEVAQVSEGALAGALAQRALTSPEPPRVRSLARAGEPELESLLPGSSNVLVVGLSAGRESCGLLLAEAGAPRISRRSVGMVGRFASHGALAFANADLKGEVARMADTDSLTGLANRRSLTKSLTREVARSQRSGEPLSLAVLDIDHFKRINDTFGHLAGDDVLRDVATAMAASVRDLDIVARYGGEEFAVVLPNCPSEGALLVVERVRAAITSATTMTKVTASAGVATVAGEASDGEALMAAADEALYESKRSGRDRVTVARTVRARATVDLASKERALSA
jgi:diguanylate cyclase (GGDEF)-like protein